MTKRIFWCLAIIAAITGFLTYRDTPVAAQEGTPAQSESPSSAFTPGNLVVVQVGDGTTTLSNSAFPVALVELTTSGSSVQTIPLPSGASSPRLVLTGNSTSEGHLVRSQDGKYLTLTGYDVPAGTATGFASAGTPRTIARVDASGTVDLTTAVTDGSTGAVRSAASTNGTDIWQTNSAVGLRYKTFGTSGASTQVTSSPTNTRVVKVINNQLYMTSGSANFTCINTVGNGTPTGSGNSTTNLPGMVCSSRSPYSFSINPAGTVLYLADDGAAAADGGIQKWTQSGGTWTKAYTLLNNGTTTTGTRGLTVDWSGANPIIYATTTAGSANTLISVTDTGAASTATVLATAPANTYFRGVDFAPSNGAPAHVQHVVDFNGDGKTDFSVVRDVSDVMTWFSLLNGSSTVDYHYWGKPSRLDLQEVGDFDGDNKSDAAVYSPNEGVFYVQLSGGGNITLPVGVNQNADFVDDYSGDGKDDAATVDDSGDGLVWTYTPSAGPNFGQPHQVIWGYGFTNPEAVDGFADTAVPGDYNGDGKGDFCAVRSAGDAEQHAIWYIHYSDGVNAPPIFNIDASAGFGYVTDSIVPGDYDGDGKTDVAIARNVGGYWQWWYKKSSTGDVVYLGTWGIAGLDVFVQGDYDGDGRTDIAVWRPTDQFFYVIGSQTGQGIFLKWGQSGDQATANYNSH